jgi:RNA polymerase sigma-70 factor (ECF subfamily)
MNAWNSVPRSAEAVDETALIRQAQQGHLDAFNQIILLHQDSLYSVAYRILDDAAAAADATQEALISAYRRFDTFQGGSLRAWLIRIVTNVCYDDLRRQKRRPTTAIDDLPGGDSDDGAPLPSSQPTPEHVLLETELQQAIQDCIRALGRDQQAVLMLCDVQGLSYQEVAESVNTNLGTVKSRLSRARVAVRQCLQGVAELLPPEYRFDNES